MKDVFVNTRITTDMKSKLWMRLERRLGTWKINRRGTHDLIQHKLDGSDQHRLDR